MSRNVSKSESEDFAKHPLGPTLRKMMDEGWLSDVAFFSEQRYQVKWTDKGRERMRWLTDLSKEVDVRTQEVFLLQAIARQHPPHKE